MMRSIKTTEALKIKRKTVKDRKELNLTDNVKDIEKVNETAKSKQ